MVDRLHHRDRLTTLSINSATASRVDSTGSQITLYLNESIDLHNKRVRLVSSDIWYVFPNVTAAAGNNTIKFVYNAITYTLTLSDGLYSLTDIAETLNEYLIIQGINTTLDIKLVDDEATSLITMTITNTHAFSLDCNDVANLLFKNYLGFTGVLADAGGGTVLFESTNRASLNSVNNIQVHVSFVGNNNFENETSGSTLLRTLPLNGPIGSRLHYEPLTERFVDCVSMDCRNFIIELKDQNGNLLDMQGESFNLEFEIV